MQKRHMSAIAFFTKQLVAIGIHIATDEEDACRLKHTISDKFVQMLKAKMGSATN